MSSLSRRKSKAPITETGDSVRKPEKLHLEKVTHVPLPPECEADYRRA